ncbi:MAG: DUF5702 domain-containing protein, partial [Clostridiales Family XIII bacterium]|nr:DUF5702 domain-containing protein [Clostridiales Family XIII bacterium]
MKHKIKSCIRGNRGSTGVLLTILFACLITLIAVFFAASRAAASESVIDASLQNAGRSVLSEYDRRLLSEYGIIAFRGDGTQIEKDIRFYANASLKKNKIVYFPFGGFSERTEVFDYDANEISADLKGYSLLDVGIFESQIKEAAVSEFIKKKTGGGIPPVTGSGRSEDPTLRKGSVIEGLPSAEFLGIGFPSLTGIELPSFGEMADRTVTRVLVNEYILSVFNHANADPISDNTFFNNEVEYILCGMKSDRSNYNGVILQLTGLRFLLNNAA